MNAEATGLGVTIGTTNKIDGKVIETASGSAVNVNKYDFNFVTTGDNGELVFVRKADIL